jgi:hypothetical protein
MKYIKYIVGLFLLLSCIHSYADDNFVDRIRGYIRNISTFNHLYPQEKVYLHFDNTGYYLGETLWFKVYPVLAEDHKPSPFSKVVYVELVSPEGTVIETKKLKAEKGQCHGEFLLRDSLYAGFYEVRAYTRAMLNFGEETVFSRVFPVFDKLGETGEYEQKMTVRNHKRKVPNQRQEAPKLKKLNFSFFPEGGNLIRGLVNTVAFKVTDEKGQSVAVSGKLYNPQQEEIGEFATVHQGMGAFNWVPEGGKYTLKTMYENKEFEFELPEALPSGYSMQVQNLHPDLLSVQIQKTPGPVNDTIGITFTCRGKLLAFETFVPDASGKRALLLPKTTFPAGVIQITLFNTQGKILAERLAFVHANAQPAFRTIAVHTSYEPYAPVDMEFEIRDETGHPEEANFSLSVRDAATATSSNYSDNIRTHLLLSSDLRGYIENPAYYFESDDKERLLALDLLMLVQGWRRYSWKQMSGVEPFEVKQGLEDKLMIEGRVLSLYRRKAQKDMEVTMWMSNSGGASLQGKCITDEQGKFNFALNDIYGKWDLNLQTKKKGKRTEENILLDRNFSPQPKYLSTVETSLPETRLRESPESQATQPNSTGKRIAEKEEILPNDSVRSHLLPEVVVTEKRKFKREDLGIHYADIIYDVASELDKLIDNNESYSESIEDFLVRTNPYFSVADMNEHGVPVCKYKEKSVLYYVDNSQIEKTIWYNPETHSIDIQLNEIEKIMISEKMSSMEYDPDKYVVVFIYTNKDRRKRNAQKGIRNTYFTGFSQAGEFYSPDYGYTHLPEGKDFRRTLYWNPEVKTNEMGKASVHFYNSSTCKELDIDAEGMTQAGVPFVVNK